jgi:hypothetical protein
MSDNHTAAQQARHQQRLNAMAQGLDIRPSWNRPIIDYAPPAYMPYNAYDDMCIARALHRNARTQGWPHGCIVVEKGGPGILCVWSKFLPGDEKPVVNAEERVATVVAIIRAALSEKGPMTVVKRQGVRVVKDGPPIEVPGAFSMLWFLTAQCPSAVEFNSGLTDNGYMIQPTYDMRCAK